METFDVVIIGAGIIGTSIARELSKYCLDVVVLEKNRDVSMGATKANSAIVHGGYAEPNSLVKGKLCYPGRKQFKSLESQLHFGFEERGSLVVTMDSDTSVLEELRRRGVENNVEDLSLWSKEEVRSLEPHLNPDIQGALHCAGAGVCSPYEMAIAMMECAMQNGVQLELQQEVKEMVKTPRGFFVTTTSKRFQSRYVVNAAGIHADLVSRMVGVDLSIFPRSGEYLLFARGSGDPISRVIFQLPHKMGKGVVVTSTFHGNLLFGPDAFDEETRDDTSTHLSRIADIFHQCKNLYPGVKPEQFIRSFSGLRARSMTDDFIIGPTQVPGFLQVAGIQSPGLTASPAIAAWVVALLKEEGLTMEPFFRFDPYRAPIIQKKPLAPFSAIRHLVDIPSSPSKIICRCEQVTEGEIVDALHRGIPLTTVDAVKRRTRASMGYCQGSFCRERIIEVMERENKEKVDPAFDVEQSGVNRVLRADFLEYLRGTK